MAEMKTSKRGQTAETKERLQAITNLRRETVGYLIESQRVLTLACLQRLRIPLSKA
jgi:hypothetical protein